MRQSGGLDSDYEFGSDGGSGGGGAVAAPRLREMVGSTNALLAVRAKALARALVLVKNTGNW